MSCGWAHNVHPQEYAGYLHFNHLPKETHRMKGKVVHELPPPNRTTGPHIDWDACALLAKQTGQVVLVAEHVRNSRIKSVRQYDRAPFITSEGRIQVHLRNSKVEEDGVRYGDVYFSWEPAEKEA